MNKRKAMLKAIKEASGGTSKTYGLRAIRRFEKVNNCAFNPCNKEHIFKVSDCGSHERFFRKANAIFNGRPIQ
jgi:hypothetical protein